MGTKELSIEEKIGQMVIIGMDTNYITERIETMITKYKIGGIILYRKNFSTYKEMLELIRKLKELNKNNKIPLFIAIDQEGRKSKQDAQRDKKFTISKSNSNKWRRTISKKVC